LAVEKAEHLTELKMVDQEAVMLEVQVMDQEEQEPLIKVLLVVMVNKVEATNQVVVAEVLHKLEEIVQDQMETLAVVEMELHQQLLVHQLQELAVVVVDNRITLQELQVRLVEQAVVVMVQKQDQQAQEQLTQAEAAAAQNMVVQQVALVLLY
jgi:hypothetical protein